MKKIKNPYGEWFGCLDLDQLATDVKEVEEQRDEVGTRVTMFRLHTILLNILKGKYAASVKAKADNSGV